jgi:hypothetical protein
MMFARFCGTPVVCICPPRSFYRREIIRDVYGADLHNWIHPFVAGLADHVAPSLDGAIDYLNELAERGCPRREHPGIEEAIAYFHRTQEMAAKARP